MNMEVNRCVSCGSLNVTLNISTNKIDCNHCKKIDNGTKIAFTDLVDEFNDNNGSTNGRN